MKTLAGETLGTEPMRYTQHERYVDLHKNNTYENVSGSVIRIPPRDVVGRDFMTNQPIYRLRKFSATTPEPEYVASERLESVLSQLQS